ncbi:MAG: metalloregulator ArsR/SmtB family transcription factor [Dehalococcoidales bacterium]|nr:metalloregulator ArsR/SmtB family transcription factor [Dehalococcoidales bacterium]
MANKNQENVEEQTALFSVLADPTRLRLLRLLSRQREPDALCVNALAGLLGVTQSAVSQHLRILKNAGLVKGERRGYHIHYFINREALEHCRNLVSGALVIEESKEGNDEKYCPARREQNVSDK